MENFKNELWNKFYTSGKIEDYLKYRQVVSEVKPQNVIEHSGIGNPGTDGERK